MDEVKEVELEEHFILRLPQQQADYIRKILHNKPKKLKKRLQIKLDVTNGNGTVLVKKKKLKSQLRKLPTISETYKTDDGSFFVKIADLSHILDCTKKNDNCVEMKHGLAPSMKNVRKCRFRKCYRNKEEYLENVRKELIYLFQADAEAVSTRFELIEDKNNNITKYVQSEIDLFGNILTDSESNSELEC